MTTHPHAHASAAASPVVLLAEDDKSVRDSIERALTFEGYTVRAVSDGGQALGALLDEEPSVVLLDVNMPNVDGLDACRRIRKKGYRTPVLMLTARHEISDRVAGLDAGADDYLVKPFALEELLARLRALVRRNSPVDDLANAHVLRLDDLELDPAARIVTRGDRALDLTKTEFELLELLVFNQNIVMPRDTLYEAIWGYDFETNSKSLDVYVGYLRRKTEVGGAARLIHTVRGVGYTARLDKR